MPGLSASVEYVRDLSLRSDDDEAVVGYAKRTNRIVVTTEMDMNEKRFRICTHPGIIVIGGNRHETIQSGSFRQFMKSGMRKAANHAVTYLTKGRARIVMEDQVLHVTLKD